MLVLHCIFSYFAGMWVLKSNWFRHITSSSLFAPALWNCQTNCNDYVCIYFDLSSFFGYRIHNTEYAKNNNCDYHVRRQLLILFSAMTKTTTRRRKRKKWTWRENKFHYISWNEHNHTGSDGMCNENVSISLLFVLLFDKTGHINTFDMWMDTKNYIYHEWRTQRTLHWNKDDDDVDVKTNKKHFKSKYTYWCFSQCFILCYLLFLFHIKVFSWYNLLCRRLVVYVRLRPELNFISAVDGMKNNFSNNESLKCFNLR